MNTHKLTITVTLFNFLLLIFIALTRYIPAAAQTAAPVLRGSALEIVDDHGRVRASIKIQPAEPNKKMPNGKSVPENVILRLIDPYGRPEVKLGASVQGGGLGLIGEKDSANVILQADLARSSLSLSNGDGTRKIVKPE